MRILIPQTLARNVLAAVRSLGRRGHTVCLAKPTGKAGGQMRSWFDSRYVADVRQVESPTRSPDGFVRDLQRLVTSEQFDVLLPFTHACVLPVSYRKALLNDNVHIPVADYEVLRLAHDKLETAKIAHSLGIPTPATFHPRNRAHLLEMQDLIPFPCLVKARQGCGVGTTIRFATDFEELLDGYEEINAQPSTPPVNDYDAPIIQEYVPGQIHDAVFLYADGEVRAALTQERVITYPIQGGPGAVNRTTDDPALLGLGKRLLDALGWHGPAQVECKFDPRDRTYKLLEINPKFWGTLPLAMAAGIDFAEMACRLAVSGDVEPELDYEVGLTYRWLFPSELNSLAQSPTAARLFDFLAIWRPHTRYDVDLRDPLPDIYRAVSTIRGLARDGGRLLPDRRDLNAAALRRPPCEQTSVVSG